MDIKNGVIGALIGLTVLIGGLYITQSPEPGAPGRDGTDGVVSAVASPDIISPYVSYGGVRNWAAHTDNLTQATTTVCALQSPAATSTLTFGGVRFTVSSTTGARITMAKASTFNSTTTSLGVADLVAGAPATVVASTSDKSLSPLDNAATFGPNQWFVVGMSGGTGTFSPTGSCSAQWTEI